MEARLVAVHAGSQPGEAPPVPGAVRVARLVSIVVALIAATALVGWLLGIDVLRSVPRGQAALKVNTAIAFLCCAGALRLLVDPGTSPARRRLRRGLAAVAAALGAAALFEYMAGVNLGIDQLVVRDTGPAAGLMAPNTALALVLVSGALALAEARVGRVWLASALPLAAGTIGLVATVGYMLSVPSFYGIGRFTAMSLPSAVIFVLLAVGIPAARPDRGAVRVLLGSTPGGHVVRRVLPVILVVAPMLAFLSWAGRGQELYGPQVSFLILVGGLMAVMTAMTWGLARSLDRADAERHAVEAELERSNAELSQFAYVASHDLNEPLRVISGFVQLLRRRYRGRLDGDADRFIDATVAGTRRMEAMIDALLQYARVGRTKVVRTQVDCGELVRGALDSLASQVEQAGADVQVSDLPTVVGDPTLLTQVFQNLISNALKFGDAAGPQVKIGARREETAWEFSVTDNGDGIDPAHADLIFEMFQRLHGRDMPGTGIGLALCKRIVEGHGGRIWVHNGDGRGSDFRFTLPAARRR